MSDPVLNKEGKETLEAVFRNLSPITREREKKRIFRALSLLMIERGTQKAGKELIIEAARLVLPPSYKGNFYMLEDPAKFKQFIVDAYFNRDAYYAVPIQVRRWDIPGNKTLSRPAEMKVLAICASPRARGNTEVLIDEALRGAQDVGAKVEKIRLQKIDLKFCIHCAKCREPGHDGFCDLKDDMALYIYQKMVEASAIIIGFPIYIGRECGQLATFFDRWYCMPVTGRRTPGAKLEDRVGMVIGTWGGAWIDAYDHIIEHVINILHVNGITTVEALSACGFGGLLHGLDDQGEARIRAFPTEIEKAYQAGKALVTG